MKIYVGNLSPDATEEELKKRFEKYGEVDSVTILAGLLTTEDENGIGFIEMPDEKRARKAIKKMNNKKVFRTKLTVNEARSKKDDRRISGRGGGRRKNDSPETNQTDKKDDKNSQKFKTEKDLFDGL